VSSLYKKDNRDGVGLLLAVGAPDKTTRQQQIQAGEDHTLPRHMRRSFTQVDPEVENDTIRAYMLAILLMLADYREKV
jgi:hypothetical protein